ncbi:MAG: T9SS type A sorting domain-containing protein [Bacteroidetes bacterium]|nr:T9SS type A sorting domain-containing protein [Bacteroidota bacterium]
MKKKTLFSFLLVVVTVCNNYAQPYFHKQWDKVYGGSGGESFHSLLQTSDNRLLIAGSSSSGVGHDKSEPDWGGGDYWLVKIDAAGNKLWDRRYGGTGIDAGLITKQTPDGGFITGGYCGSGLSGDKTEPGRGGWDFWIVKTDAVGNKEWDKRFGGTGDDILWTLDVCKDGGYILGGRSDSGIGGDKSETNQATTALTSDYWVVKIDSAGHKEWDKRFGGAQEDDLRSVIQTTDGGYILGGFSYSGISGDKTEANWDTAFHTADYWIVKIDSLGFKEWDKRFGTITDERLYTVLEIPHGGYIIFFWGGVGINGDKTIEKGGWWVIKTDALGNKVNEYIYAGQAFGKSMVETSDGGYLMSGDALFLATMDTIFDKTELNLGSQNTWIIKVDSNGLKQWDKTIFTTGADENGLAIQTADGCYAIANTSKSGIGAYKTQAAWDSSYDYFIMKFCMDTVTAIDDRQQTTDDRQIQVYPNPFTNDLSIALKGENIHEAIFTITNALGQVIYNRKEENLANGYTKMLDLSYLPGGFYFITVTQNGELFTKKVVKE